MSTLSLMLNDDKALTNCSGLILAGGRGQRMQGADKGLQLFQGRALVSHVLSRLAPQVHDLLIVCNRNRDAYAQLAPQARLLQDRRPDFPGPLAGIEAALAASQQDFLLICPCDCPTLPQDLGQRLYAVLTQTGSDAAVVHDGERQQHLFMLLRRSTQTTLSAYLDSGERSVFGFLQQITTSRVDFSAQKDAFHNLNSLQALQTYPQK